MGRSLLRCTSGFITIQGGATKSLGCRRRRLAMTPFDIILVRGCHVLAGDKTDEVQMDVSMPVMGGMEATGLIREFESSENVSRTPIIALTAHAMIGTYHSAALMKARSWTTQVIRSGVLKREWTNTVRPF